MEGILNKEKNSAVSFNEGFFIITFLLLGLFLRIYSVVINGIGHTIDSYNYIKQADLLIKGGYSIYFPNGFPLIIALIIPFSPFFDLSTILVILNITLSTATIYLIYKICDEGFNNKYLSITAVIIAAFYPNQIKYVHWILSEVPCAFFITLSLYFWVKKRAGFSGAALGFASMIRTTLLPVGIFFTLYLLIKKNSLGYKFFSLYAVIPMIFLTYGFVKTGYFTIGQNAAHNLSISTEYSDTSKFPRVNLKNLNGSFKDYAAYAVGNPSEFLHDRLENLWDLWGPTPPLSKGFKWSAKFFWSIGIRFLILLFAAFGFIKSYKKPAAVFCAVAVASITAVHVFYFADPRFTYSIEPFAIILASIGMLELLSIRNGKLPAD